MATDTARIKLELASGRNEITAPYHHTAQRRRTPDPNQSADAESAIGAAGENSVTEVASASASAFDPVLVDVPLADPASLAEPLIAQPLVAVDRPRIGVATWIAFAAALIAVAAAVWWIMLQRLPDIDPREVIQRNLAEAQQAMAAGRYTDPAERNAFHYYSTVLALDPTNADAITGIDAIADRHLTDARVLLGERRIAEAGVALERARRVRPNHSGLAALDGQLRGELRKLLLPSSSALAAANTDLPAAKSVSSRATRGDTPPTNVTKRVAVAPTPLALANVSSQKAPDVPPAPAAELPNDFAATGAVPLASEPEQTLATPTAIVAPTISNDNAAGASATVDAPPASAPPTITPSAEPKLVRMVEPEYPQEALIRGMEGWVDVSLQVSAAGDVIAPRVEATSRGRLFNRAALAAVQQWKYAPRSGDVTEERILVRLKFRQSN